MKNLILSECDFVFGAVCGCSCTCKFDDYFGWDIPLGSDYCPGLKVASPIACNNYCKEQPLSLPCNNYAPNQKPVMYKCLSAAEAFIRCGKKCVYNLVNNLLENN